MRARVSNTRPTTAPSGKVARRTGRLTAWTKSSSLVSSSGTRSTMYPGQSPPVALLCHSKDSYKQNIIPDTDHEEALVFIDVVKVTIEAAGTAMKTGGWRFGYSFKAHSSLLTVPHYQKLTKGMDPFHWSNLTTHCSIPRRVYYQLERMTCPGVTEVRQSISSQRAASP